MKKIAIYLLVTAVLIAGLFVLTGCGETKDNGTNSNPKSENINNNEKKVEISTKNGSKALGLMQGDYYLKYEGEEDGETIQIEFTQKGSDKYAMFVVMGDETLKTIEKDGKDYTIIDSEKVIMVSNIEEGEALADNNLLAEDEYSADFTTGKETIDGVEYDYENFEDIKFYFIGNDLKYIKDSETMIKVLAYKNEANEALFEMPEDYEQIDYSNL